MNELPWRCSTCGSENMVDLQHLSEWPIDKIVTALGFVCAECGTREAILYSSSALEETMRKLNRYSPGQKQFQFLLEKCIRKARSLRQRGECDGAQQHQNLVAT